MESKVNQLLRVAPLEDAMSASTSEFAWANFQPTYILYMLLLTKLQFALCSEGQGNWGVPVMGREST